MYSPWKHAWVIVYLWLVGWVAASIDVADFAAKDILDYDAVVVGGGAAGTYAAIRLHDMDKTVAVVEKKGRLGGHTETYTDPVSKAKIDIAVVVFQNTDFVRKYFARFNIPLTLYNQDTSGVTKYVDFSTGKAVPGYALPNATLTLQAYAAQLAKYPFLDQSLGQIPTPVPDDLLLPFGDFIKKYDLQDALPFFSIGLGQGFGNILKLPTLYLMKYYSAGLLQNLITGSLTTARHDNSELYEKAQAELGKDVFLNSCARNSSTPRNSSPPSPPPPSLRNLHGWDLDSTELPIFEKFQYHSYDVGILNHTGIPSNTPLVNVGASTPYNIPILPSAYNIFATAAPGLHVFQFDDQDHQVLPTNQVKANIVACIERMRAAGTLPRSNDSTVEWPVYSSHTPYECYVSTREIKEGFYERLFGLQGRRNTWWSGAAWVAHDSSAIWEFTETVVRGLRLE